MECGIGQCGLHFLEECHLRGGDVFVDICILAINRVCHQFPSAATHHSHNAAGSFQAYMIVCIYILVCLYLHMQQTFVQFKLPLPSIVVVDITYAQTLVWIKQITRLVFLIQEIQRIFAISTVSRPYEGVANLTGDAVQFFLQRNLRGRWRLIADSLSFIVLQIITHGIWGS